MTKEYTLEELWEFFPDAKFITMNFWKENIDVWDEKPLINNLKEWYWKNCKVAYIRNGTVKEFRGKEPEYCIAERPVDYSRWIGKLVYFYNGLQGKEILNNDRVGVLKFFNESQGFYNGWCFREKCRPLTEEEVKKYIFKE